MKPVAVIKYSDFYDTPHPDDTFDLLRQYPTDLIILRLSKINHFLFHELKNPGISQKLIVDKCFSHLKPALLSKINRELADISDSRELAFFTGPSILKLINVSFLNFCPIPAEDEAVDISQFEEDLFKSILICNDLYYDDALKNSDLTSYESIWRLQMMQQMNIRDHIELIFLAPIRNFLFHKYMISEFPEGRKYLKEFAENLELKGYFEYNMLFQGITFQVINEYQADKDPKHILNLSNAQMKIIQNFAIKPCDLEEGKYHGETHAELIPHPFYLSMDKHPVILDLYFFNYIVDLALTYNIYQYSSLHKLPQFKSFPAFKGFLGKSFYEDFTMKEIVKNIFREKNYSLFNSNQNAVFPDFAVVRNQRDILLIEVKSSALNYKTMQELNVDEFKMFLDDNFKQQKQNSKTKNKGTYQLATQIKNFAETKLLDKLLKQPERKQKAIIYPVIVYVDNSLDMAGVNNYLNDSFRKEMAPFKAKFRKIFPVIAINLGFFLRHFIRLQQQPSLLFELISDYFKKVDRVKKEFDLHPHPMPFFNYNISFDQFISQRFPTEKQNFSAIIEGLNLLEE